MKDAVQNSASPDSKHGCYYNILPYPHDTTWPTRAPLVTSCSTCSTAALLLMGRSLRLRSLPSYASSSYADLSNLM